MIFKYLKSGLAMEDSVFDAIFPEAVKDLAEIHFTPIDVSRVAARFLAHKPHTKILDIGSGAGKFCMIGAACTNGHFTGVEQRENLCSVSRSISAHYQLDNVNFIHSNITDVNFQDFDAFYFFNPFFENICAIGMIEDDIILNIELYVKYSLYVKTQLEAMPVGTRLVTYFTYQENIPVNYKVQSTSSEGKLKMWEKVL